MTYAETERELQKMCNKDDLMFRMAVSHLMDVGIRHLTNANVEATCASIMKQDDSNSFMTNELQCELIRWAAKLATFDHIYLLAYIQRHVDYDVGDDVFPASWKPAIQSLLDDLTYDRDDALIYEELSDAGLTDGDIAYFGYDEVIPTDHFDKEDEYEN